jgi:hypothetical protein
VRGGTDERSIDIGVRDLEEGGDDCGEVLIDMSSMCTQGPTFDIADRRGGWDNAIANLDDVVDCA